MGPLLQKLHAPRLAHFQSVRQCAGRLRAVARNHVQVVAGAKGFIRVCGRATFLDEIGTEGKAEVLRLVALHLHQGRRSGVCRILLQLVQGQGGGTLLRLQGEAESAVPPVRAGW